MGRIVQLSKNVVNQIAAGEVIERPFSVVKELVENSIDAEANKISIEISNECRNIRIADNGTGIHPDDIELAFSKHATSKILSGEDLYKIKTMGFRGEALASIISISKLTCITRTKDFNNGVKAECENSEIRFKQTGCAVGTVMEIRDLFYNIPARLKFLKSEKTEFAYISELIQNLAIAHPNISFELKNNEKISIKTTGQGSVQQVIREIFSPDVSKNLVEVLKTDKLSGLKITGYVSTPAYTRASKKDYYIYVNSRTIKCPVFQKAIDTVYRNLIGNARHPFIVLNLDIPPEDVDVNVHPQKKEVRYKNPNQIFNFIYSSVDMALSGIKEKTQTEQFENPLPNTDSDEFLVDSNYNLGTLFNAIPPTDSEKSAENVYSPAKHEFKQSSQEPLIVKQKQIFTREQIIEKDNIIGQYKKTYILIEKDEGLEIVDQHIAEERYIYEQLKNSKNIDCQLLFISDVIEISKSDKEILNNNIEKLEKYGYELNFLSDTEVVFKKVPQILSKVPPKEILSDILENIAGNIDNMEEQILITTSCKAAVKANTYLNMFQMQEIIENWRTCKNPLTCPHGRPISKIIEHKDIAKFFQRTK